MSGKLKIHVDQEKCQGHARCKSLAPELFELDEFGNAHEIGDGSVPAGLEDMACQGQLPGNRDRRDRGMSRTSKLFTRPLFDLSERTRGICPDDRFRPR
jgi:ferredoxin